MRAIWSGDVSFGLVGVPVKLYSATRSHDVSFHQVHDDDGGRIRYERHCEVCGRVIDYDHIEKAYEDGDKTVVLTDEELEALPADENDEIEVVQFVPGEQIDPLLLGTAYYLEPVGKSPKSYLLLRGTLDASELTAVVRFTLRSKTRLGVLRTHGKLLVLQTLRWPEDLREVDFPGASSRAKVSDRERKAADALVQQFAGDFDPAAFSDEYQDQLRELIDDKLEQGDALDTDATFGKDTASGEDGDQGGSGGGKVLSLMDALEGSLSRRGSGRKGSDSSSGTSSSSRKTSSGKKPSAKRSTTGRNSSDEKTSSGGKKSAGGKKSTGGKKSAGGKKASGGTKASGGKTSSGGKKSSGGKSSGDRAKSA